MIDIKLVRADWQAVADNLARRGVPRENVERLHELDETWRRLIAQAEELRAQQNEANDSIAAAAADAKTSCRQMSPTVRTPAAISSCGRQARSVVSILNRGRTGKLARRSTSSTLPVRLRFPVRVLRT
jgi:seryl-tRNA synthetase